MSALLPSIGSAGSGILGALPYLAAVAGPLFGYYAARLTAIAPLQMALNDAFRATVGEWARERAGFIARIAELEGTIMADRATINQGIAREDALQRRINRLLEDRE